MQSPTPFEWFRRALEHEELNAEFQSRARELQDLLLNEDQLWKVINEVAALVNSRSSGGESLGITSLERDGVLTIATTMNPHGFAEGQSVFVKGAQPFSYSGEKTIESVPSPTQFSYRGSIFAPAPEQPTDETVVSSTPDGGSWWEIDQARWDRHPESRSVEGPSQRTGSFYVNPFRYTRFSGKVRELVSPDFPGMVEWVKRFTVPGGFGGTQLQVLADGGPKEPNKPTISYDGPEDFPIDQLTFSSSTFSGGTLFQQQEFVAMKWRVARVHHAGIEGFEPGDRNIYEIDPIWESKDITAFEPAIYHSR